MALRYLFPAQTGRGKSSSLLRLTCTVGLGRGRDVADTVRVCGECPLLLRPAGSLHSLRQIVRFPRGVGLGPWQSRAAQAPRKTWVATLSRSQLGGSCSLWGRDLIGPLPSTSGICTCLSASGAIDHCHLAPIWHSPGLCPFFCERAELKRSIIVFPWE